MELFILLICGVFVIASWILGISYGSSYFRMRELWIGLATAILGLAGLFFLPFYINSICWLIAGGSALVSVMRAFRHRKDKKMFKKPEIRTIETTERMGEIIPISTPPKTPEPPKTA